MQILDVILRLPLIVCLVSDSLIRSFQILSSPILSTESSRCIYYRSVPPSSFHYHPSTLSFLDRVLIPNRSLNMNTVQSKDNFTTSQTVTNVNERQDIKNKESRETEDDTFSFCIRLWILCFGKALVIVFPILLTLWVFFLPLLVLRNDLLESIKDLIYVKVYGVFFWSAFYGFPATYGILIFGYAYLGRILLYCVLPGLIFGTFLSIFLSDILSFILIFLVVVISIIIVYREKLPSNPSQQQIDQYERKTQLSKRIGQMTLVVWVIYLVLRSLYPLFMISKSQGKVFIRFVILPLVMTCCSGLQLYILKSVPRKHIDFMIPMLWISNGYLKMWERIFTNSMFNSGDYLPFAIATIASSIIEVVNHATYLHRAVFVEKMIQSIRRLKEKQSRSMRTISVAPTDQSKQMHQDGMGNSYSKLQWLEQVRKDLIIEDIAIELIMIFAVTFLLYFVHPLIKNEDITTMPTFQVCIIQLSIQLAFEIPSDLFGLYWTCRVHRIALKIGDVQIKNRWFWLWILFILFQSLLIFWFLISF